MLKSIFSLILPIVLAACATSRNPKPEPVSAHGVEIDFDLSDLHETKAVLEDLLHRYDLRKYLFTRKVVLRPMAIPHSHPVLTLNTRERKRPEFLLSTFVHEQIHWHLDAKQEKTSNVIAALKKRYPKVPRGFPKASDDDDSTYLHLVVNWLELRALEQILGAEQGRKVLREKDYYTWIYERVLSDDKEIGTLVRGAGLEIE